MADRQCGELLHSVGKESVEPDHERAGPQLGQRRKDRIEVTFSAGVQDAELQPERAGRCLQFSRLGLGNSGIGRVDHECNGGCGRDQFVQQLQPLRPQLRAQVAHARDVATRMVEAGDETQIDRVTGAEKDDRNSRGRLLCRQCPSSATEYGDHGHLSANQLVRQRQQSIVLPLRPPVFDRHVAALDVAGVAQASAERGQAVRPKIRRCAAEEPDHRQPGLLRPRRERPRRRRTAEGRDELAPSHHSITSSARCCRNQGTSRPSVVAVLRLMTSSNFVGCSTGRSAGLAPLRMRPA